VDHDGDQHHLGGGHHHGHALDQVGGLPGDDLEEERPGGGEQQDGGEPGESAHFASPAASMTAMVKITTKRTMYEA